MEAQGSGRYRGPRSQWFEPTVDTAGKANHEWLQRLPFFAERDPEFVRQLAQYLEVTVFQAGDYIMRQGDLGDKMYVLHRGKVEVLVGENAVPVAVLGDGAVFGEMALLLGSTQRTATIRAVEICSCRSISHGVCHLLLKRFPAEQRYFAEMARERKKKLQELKEAVKPVPRTRLMRLSAIAKQNCYSSESSNVSPVPSPAVSPRLGSRGSRLSSRSTATPSRSSSLTIDPRLALDDPPESPRSAWGSAESANPWQSEPSPSGQSPSDSWATQATPKQNVWLSEPDFTAADGTRFKGVVETFRNGQSRVQRNMGRFRAAASSLVGMTRAANLASGSEGGDAEAQSPRSPHTPARSRHHSEELQVIPLIE